MLNLFSAFLPLLLAGGDQAALHPQTAVAFVEIPDFASLDEAYSESSLMRLFADEEVQKTIESLLGETFHPGAALREAMGEQLLRADAEEADQLLGSLASASISVSTESGGLEDSLASYGLQVCLELREGVDVAAARNTWVEVLSRQNPEAVHPEEVSVEGGGIGSVLRIDDAIPGFGSVWLASSERRMVLGAGVLDSADALRRLDDASSASLAKNEGYQASSRAIGTPEYAPVFEAYSIPGDGLRQLFDIPDLGPAIAILEGLFGTNVSMLAGGGRWRTSLREGRFVTEGYQPQRTPKSPLADLLGTKPVDPSATRFISPDAVLAWIVHFDREGLIAGLPALLDNGREGQGEAFLAEIESEYGFRFDRDLIAPLGSNLAFNLPPLRSIMAAPDLRLTLSLSDHERFIEGMNGLVKLLAHEQFAATFAVKATAYRKLPLYTLSFVSQGQPQGALPIDPASFVRPTVAVLEDRVIIALLPTYAKREIRRIIDDAKAIEKGEEIATHAHFSAAAVPEGAYEVAYADWAALLSGVYSGIRSIAPMIGGMVDLPVDLASLPEPEIFTRFFEPSLRTKRAGKNGEWLHYAESSFGPEMPLALLGVTAVNLMPRGGPRPETIEVVPVDASQPTNGGRDEAHESTLQGLKDLRVALTVFKLEHQGFPEKLSALLEPTTNYPSGFLSGAALPIDGWSRDFVYARTETGYGLWSCGEDGVDQRGEGDDVPLP